MLPLTMIGDNLQQETFQWSFYVVPSLHNNAILDYLNEFLLVYLDDLLVYSKTAALHLEHVRKVLDRLRSEKWFAKRAKSDFAKTSVKYLGHVVS